MVEQRQNTLRRCVLAWCAALLAACAAAATASAHPSGAAAVAGAAPVLTELGQSHRVWRAGTRLVASARRRHKPPVGTVFTYVLSEAAAVKVTFTQSRRGRIVGGTCLARTRADRHRPSCTRTITRGVLRFSAHANANVIAFQGRLTPSRKLAPGSYTAAFVATSSEGVSSAPQTLTFTIAPG